MNPPMLERRRSVRTTVSAGIALPLNVSFTAQVIEISSSGVLLWSRRPLRIGERGALSTTVGNRSLDVAVEIRSVSQETRPRDGSQYRIGASFVDMTMEQRMLLLELLGVERN